MTNVIKVPDEDLAETDRLEAQADRTEDPDEAAGLILVASFVRTPPNYPVVDDPRTLPRDPVHGGGGEFQIKPGPYKVDARVLKVLHWGYDGWLNAESEYRMAAGVRQRRGAQAAVVVVAASCKENRIS